MTSQTTPRAVVVGGGIGGLATALALQHNGWRVTVHERRDHLDRGGAGLVLWPNAMRCLAVLGIADVVRAHATPLNGSAIRRADGHLLSRMAPDPRRGLDDRPLGIVRADLIDALAVGLDPDVLRLDSEVRDASDLDASDSDLIIGADGVHSRVRASVTPTCQPVFRGYTVWRAVVDADVVPASTARPELSETWGTALRFGIVPVGAGATYIYATALATEGGRGDELAELQRRFSQWHAPIPALLDAIDPSAVLRHDIYDLPPGGTPLHRGRRVLVGDAGHAMEPNLGQGAGLALEDAVVLAQSLAVSPSVDQALVAYSRARAKRVAALSRQSRQIGRMAGLTNPSVIAVRNLAMRATPSRLARRAAGAAANWQPPQQDSSTPQESR